MGIQNPLPIMYRLLLVFGLLAIGELDSLQGLRAIHLQFSPLCDRALLEAVRRENVIGPYLDLASILWVNFFALNP